jgi:hypothetical protein
MLLACLHVVNVPVQEVIEIALGMGPSNRLVQETALFSLGNMANHAAMVAVMQSSKIESQVNTLLESPHSNLRAVAGRLASKLKAWNDDTRVGVVAQNTPAHHLSG